MTTSKTIASPSAPLSEQRIHSLLRQLFPESNLSDDAAILSPKAGKQQLVTADALVEDIHFRRDTISPKDLAFKAVTANVSDIAAMGGVPQHLTLSVSLPKDLEEPWILAFLTGLHDAAQYYGCQLIGGDTTASPGKIFISLTAIGEAPPTKIKQRSGAKAGDVIALTGRPGLSLAGLRLLLDQQAPNTEAEHLAITTHTRPMAHLDHGTWLGSHPQVTAMMDVSDGIAMDLPRLLLASSLAATINVDQLPHASELAILCKRHDWPLAETILSSGEEYCLLLTIKPQAFKNLALAFNDQFNQPLYTIGVTEPGDSVQVTYCYKDQKIALTPTPFQHFSK